MTSLAPAAPLAHAVDESSAVREARARLAALAHRWRRRLALVRACFAAAILLPLAAAVVRELRGSFASAMPWLLVAAVATLGAWIAAAIAMRRALDLPAIAAHLDRRQPSLEESAVLLVAPGALTPLARLQRARVASALAAFEPRELARLLPRRSLGRATAALAAGALLATLVGVVPLGRPHGGSVATRRQTARPTMPPPLLADVALTVAPPAYTGHPARRVAGIATTVEEGATLTWRVRARPPVRGARVLLDESETVTLAPRDGALTGSAVLRAPRLVSLRLDGDRGELWRSPPARIDVTPDRPPAIEVLQPGANVERPVAQPGSLLVEAALGDDYGTARAEVVVTVAEGAGEDVRFHEHRIALAVRPAGPRQVVRATLPLAALGFGAERELYVRVEARDRREPEPNVARSATVVVRAAGEKRASAPLGSGIVALALPELLRSERQIVIDTERLIADAPRLAHDDLLRRSRTIALDQHALRLRYGTLLGQEVENGQAADDQDDAGALPRSPNAPPSAGPAAGSLPPGFVHQHDNAESSTFFPDPVRRKLRAMLGAMWEAEGALSAGAPRQALPHERTALALLKEVQQADRVYVAQSTTATAPLDPQRRLTGELDEVHDQRAATPASALSPEVQAALAAVAVLEQTNATPPASTVAALAPALARRARDGSAAALAALPAMDLAGRGAALPAAARAALVRALWEMVPPPQVPVRRQLVDDPLWQRYRQRLGEAPP